MPAAEFSEFSYGYAVVRQAEDLLTTMGAPLVGAPTLPSLLKENTVGYDAELVMVDFALFLQFKRSFFVSRRHPQGVCGIVNGGPHCTWAHWQTEHYRFDVDTNSDQFVIMRGYETDISLGYRSGLSLYVAPAFHHQSELDDAYSRGAVLDRSVGVVPSTFDVVPAGEHHFSFDASMTTAAVLSDPVAAPVKSAADQVASEVDRQSAAEPTEGDPLTLASLAAWADNQPVESLPRRDFDRTSAPQTLAYLNDFAGLLGGAFVLLGHVTEADD